MLAWSTIKTSNGDKTGVDRLPQVKRDGDIGRVLFIRFVVSHQVRPMTCRVLLQKNYGSGHEVQPHGVGQNILELG